MENGSSIGLTFSAPTRPPLPKVVETGYTGQPVPGPVTDSARLHRVTEGTGKGSDGLANLRRPNHWVLQAFKVGGADLWYRATTVLLQGPVLRANFSRESLQPSYWGRRWMVQHPQLTLWDRVRGNAALFESLFPPW